MRVAGVGGEDHLACFRGFGIAREGCVSLGSGGVANGEVLGHLVEVEHGDGNRVGEGDGVAHVDQRMDRRQRAVFPKPAQQRLPRAPVLGGFQAHLAECAPPSGDLGELALRPFGQPSRGPERPGGVGDIGGLGDASDRQGGDRQLGELVEQLR
jgi:hypothetical protein